METVQIQPTFVITDWSFRNKGISAIKVENKLSSFKFAEPQQTGNFKKMISNYKELML
jgi:hypothetical protein